MAIKFQRGLHDPDDIDRVRALLARYPGRCGVAVVDVRVGREVGFFEFTAGCEELYDVQFLTGVRRPMILNLQRPEARQAFTNPASCYWLRPSSEIRDLPQVPSPGTDRRLVAGAGNIQDPTHESTLLVGGRADPV